MEYLITVPQMAKSKKNKVYNLNNKIIEIEFDRTYPNGTTIVKDKNNNQYEIMPYNMYNVNMDYISIDWTGKTQYLLYTTKEDASEMNKKLLNRIIEHYQVLMDELVIKVQDINKLVKED